MTREPGPVDEESVDPASRAIVNEAVLDEVASVFAGGDVRKMREIVDLFVLTSRENVSGVRRALRAGDAKTLETVAHRLKGSAATMGAERVAAAAAAVSTHARKNDLPAAQQAAVELDRELNELVSMLRRRRAA